MNGILLFCDVDDNGKIVESLIGERVIPVKQYDYFFYITGKNADTVVSDIPSYKVVNGDLTIEG